MWWSYVTWTVAFGLSFMLGYLGCEVWHALRRPRAIPNPYAKYFQNQGAQGAPWDATDDAGYTEEMHRHTRPPGWHP